MRSLLSLFFSGEDLEEEELMVALLAAVNDAQEEPSLEEPSSEPPWARGCPGWPAPLGSGMVAWGVVTTGEPASPRGGWLN